MTPPHRCVSALAACLFSACAFASLSTDLHGSSYEGAGIGAAGAQGGSYGDSSGSESGDGGASTYSYDPHRHDSKPSDGAVAVGNGLPLLLPNVGQGGGAGAGSSDVPDYSYSPLEEEGGGHLAGAQDPGGRASYNARAGGRDNPLLPTAERGASGGGGGATSVSSPASFPRSSTRGQRNAPRPSWPPPPSPPDLTHEALYWTHEGSIRTNALGGAAGAFGTELRIKGVSWFGLESKPCSIGGLEKMSVEVRSFHRPHASLTHE